MRVVTSSFDPYGLGLENFDVIGKYRTMDPEGRPIDASVTLPANAGGAEVLDAAGMADASLPATRFVSCMTKNFIAFALAEGSAALDSCATVAIKDRFDKSDKSFSSMIREIALSKTLGTRAPGARRMRSYRFARRSFLAGIGGAVGLEVLLQNLEASAQG